MHGPNDRSHAPKYRPSEVGDFLTAVGNSPTAVDCLCPPPVTLQPLLAVVQPPKRHRSVDRREHMAPAPLVQGSNPEIRMFPSTGAGSEGTTSEHS